MLSSFLTRDKWVEDLSTDNATFRTYIPVVRWKFGDQEGTYDTRVSRIGCACLPPANAESPSLT